MGGHRLTLAQTDKKQGPVLITGATGYVGGRLAPRLLAAGFRVRAAGRSLAKLGCRPWARHQDLELVQVDVMDPVSLARACSGCWAAFYLVHSMNPKTGDYAAADRQAARNMAMAAEAAGLERIIYLGGLVPDDPEISHHLASRAEVGRILQAGAVPATWLKAAMLLGAGSASFEILRYLVERLPVMITPTWVRTPCQPIAIENALGYLQGCLETDQVLGQALDIGGPEVVSYQRLFQIYAQEAGLKPRLIIPVPVLSPRLSSLWINLITPMPAAIARPLSEGLKNEVVVKDTRIQKMIPQELITCRRAIRRSLERIEQQKVESCWSDAGQVLPPEWVQCGDAPFAGGTVMQTGCRLRLAQPPEEVWPAVAAIGGETGWYFAQSLWRLRGLLDKLAGGVSLGRGRRHPNRLGAGDALDFWRVLEADPPRRLLLLSEMKLPGEAVLEFRLEPQGQGTELQLMPRFLPRGLAGLLYWRAHQVIHHWLYLGMLQGLARRAGLTPLGPPQVFEPGPIQACRL